MRDSVILGIFLLLAGAELLSAQANLKQALTFHAPFDGGVDAAFAKGDKRLYTAPDYKKLGEAKAGLHAAQVELARGRGRFGDALWFKKKNARAIYYAAPGNVAFDPRNWTGTTSFWLKLDPDQDLEPGYCDPIQLTPKTYNDAAIWVDFTKDDTPRHFRLGVFGDLRSWNPQDLPPDKNPDFLNRLVVVKKTPFGRDRWVQVTVTHSGLGSGKGTAKLYLNGKLQGTTPVIKEPFTWNLAEATIRLGLSYVGLFDDLAIFDRALTDSEVAALHGLKEGIQSLR
jgi:hypothetical protein